MDKLIIKHDYKTLSKKTGMSKTDIIFKRYRNNL